MPSYLGVDFGGAMVKVAACPSADAPPQLLPLTGADPFIPTAVHRRDPAGDLQAGWEAYAERRRAIGHVAVHFRDRVVAVGSTFPLGGQSAPGSCMLEAVFREVRQAIQNATADVAGLAFTVPDTWPPERWGLPIALAQAGWVPTLYVRESCAALSAQDAAPEGPALLLSLGTTGARATLLAPDETGWRSLASAGGDAGGLTLRRRLLDRLAEEVIRSTRRDPREDPDADQRLHDALDMALIELQRGSASTVRANLFGQEFRRPLERAELAALGEPLRLAVEQLVEQLVKGPGAGAAPVWVGLWGELAWLTPAADWMTRWVPATAVQRWPLDVVAAGAARLAARALTGPLSVDGHVCPGCGACTIGESGPACPACGYSRLPLLEHGLRLVSASSPTGPRLVQLGSSRTQFIGERLRLGRNPQSDWSFCAEEYPAVSAAHAVIVHEGGQYVLVDLDSRNGTFVNGRQVRRHLLADQDEITLGREGPRLRFEAAR